MAVPLWRFILVYILYVIICGFFAIIGYKVLKRDIKARLNQSLFLFHLSLVFALIITFIYASISNPSLEYVVVILHRITIYLIIIAAGFLLLFIILLYDSENKFTSNKFQILYIIIYNTLGLGLFFIPNGVNVEILPDGTQLYPVWNVSFFIYYLTILITNLIASLIICLKIYKKIRIKALAKRLRQFLIGICCIYYMGFGVGFTNFLNIPLLRNIFVFTQAVPIIGVILIYYSVGTSLRKQ
ncbi:MAG: hypothetical protein ACFFHV_19615 [Promethearchaeota archaeon]